MDYKKFPYATQKTTNWTRKVERYDVQFGNGYSESYMRDPHGSITIIDFQYTNKTEIIKDVLSFLKEHEDGTPFYIFEPIERIDVLVRMNTNVSYTFDYYSGTIKCQFKEIRV